MASDPAAEFQHLVNQKEIAAYSMAAVVATIVLFQEALSLEEILDQLTEAHDEFQQADRRINQFRKSQLGASHNGNRPAA